MKRESVFLDGPVGRLEAILELDGQVEATAVICHPHPLYQGTMDNKVAYTLARAAVQCGAAALRFNFRSVGKSEGEHDNGHGELEDFFAAERWLEARYPDLPRWRLGFSFGAAMVIKACMDNACDDLVSVAPPVDRFADYGLGESGPKARRWLLAQGDKDEVVSASATLDWARSLDQPPEIAVFEGVGHFFHGNLTALRQRVCATLSLKHQELE